MALSKQYIQNMYQVGASYYDSTIRKFRLVAFRIEPYRSHAVDLLHLKKGDCVVELGCGTGLNFPFIMERIGNEGRLIGVDLTPGMLSCAKDKIEDAGWQNVKLIQADIEDYKLNGEINAVLSTGVFGYIPEYDRVIKSISSAIVPSGKFVILDGKRPEYLPKWLLRAILHMGKSSGLTYDYFDVRPWESVEKYFKNVAMEKRYAGIVYISSGETPVW